MRFSPRDFDAVPAQLQGYFLKDGHMLDWDTVVRLGEVPYCIEEESLLCVCAGLSLDGDVCRCRLQRPRRSC